MVISALYIALQLWNPAPISQDSADALRDLAHRAEWSYEFLLRRLAPTRRAYPPSSQRCDEIVGRFCLTYDSDNLRRPDTTVAGKVISARQQAVEVLRKAFAALPGDLLTVGPLLRYLIEDGRADEAVAAARTFAWASADSAWGNLLLGYALHAAQSDSLAELHFREGLARLDYHERRRIEGVGYLLERGERATYEKLSDARKIIYENALWRLADPLYLTPGNERLAEHMARHIWSRLLAEAPRVRRMYRWGQDLEELTVRYGVPTSRERLLANHHLIDSEETMVEYFDPNQLAYIPETLYTDGVPPAPPPGSTWILERERARSGYHPLTLRRLYPLEFQLSRFPNGESTLMRFDAAIKLDSIASGAEEVEIGLFLLDRGYHQIYQNRETIPLRGDSAILHFEVEQPPGIYIYSIELLEGVTRFAARARYSTELPDDSEGGVALSDPMITEPFGAGPPPTDRDDSRVQPLTSLTLTLTDTIGLYAEAHHLIPGDDSHTHFRVYLKIGLAEDPSILARAWGWIGRKIGLARPTETPTLAWDGRGPGEGPAILAVDLPLANLRAGLYTIELEVTDLVAVRTASTSRLIRIRE